jgi:hypothetical protein
MGKARPAMAQGGTPDDLSAIATPEKSPTKLPHVFIHVVNGFKPKAPAAAMALIKNGL